jgi:hypothetical protein
MPATSQTKTACRPSVLPLKSPGGTYLGDVVQMLPAVMEVDPPIATARPQHALRGGLPMSVLRP